MSDAGHDEVGEAASGAADGRMGGAADGGATDSAGDSGDDAVTVASALAAAAARIAREARSETARLDAELLLGDALGVRREDLFAAPERVLDLEERLRFERVLKRRGAFEPVAYILGRRAFRTIELEVNDNTLIPRPETETLVEVALERLAALECDEPLALDIGTGSGNIALALAAEHPTVHVLAVDFHPAPLEVAARNVRRLGLDGRVMVMLSDVYDDLPPGLAFDLIVSNPPYVTPESLRRLRPEIRGWEPHVALRAERGGMQFYERIVPGAPPRLRPGGALAVEIPEMRLLDVLSLFVEVGAFEDIDARNDLGGRPRVVSGRLKAPAAGGAGPAAGAENRASTGSG
ncbi:MAG TPA: peptide chain release factor N(5)-glutamine methyltransferase [Thermoleophilia bacterium]|nr:peptide chain release factor N(5)-glutamine methyltransferase [Thermoleophilia bacterium]